MSTESNILFDVFELYSSDDEQDTHSIALIGYVYYPCDKTSPIRLYRHFESPLGQIDFIWIRNPAHYYDRDKDLYFYLGDEPFYKVKTGKVAYFSKESLFNASRIRLSKFHQQIEALPSFQW